MTMSSSDDDDDEGDFVPGADDEDDDEEEDDSSFHILDGTLSVSADGKLCYKGEGFLFSATAPAAVNVFEASSLGEGSQPQVQLEMVGTCELEKKAGVKPAPRTMTVRWTVGEPPVSSSTLKDDDDAQGKKGPAVYYQVYGRQEANGGGDLIEFRGGYYPDGKESVNLICQARSLVLLAAAAAKPAAAAVATRQDSDDDDDDDDDDEADDDVDYDELMALQQDANVSVDELRKRYSSQGGATDEQPAAKRGKVEDDDDDSDYGF